MLATWAVFDLSLFKYFLAVSKRDIEDVVVFFDTLGGGIETFITEMRTQSLLDKELELDSLLLFLG